MTQVSHTVERNDLPSNGFLNTANPIMSVSYSVTIPVGCPLNYFQPVLWTVLMSFLGMQLVLSPLALERQTRCPRYKFLLSSRNFVGLQDATGFKCCSSIADKHDSPPKTVLYKAATENQFVPLQSTC